VIAGMTGALRVSPGMQAHLKRVRVALGYAAIAIGVTAGGTIVGATVVAPVVSSASMPRVANEVRKTIKGGALLHSVPDIAWRYLGVAVALATVAMIVWRLRARSAAQPRVASHVANKRSIATLPEKLTGGRVGSRTPREVLALAQAGNAPVDIARRTGMSLDAVSMCLSLSSLSARQ
jgi:hypothetical protein